MQRLSRSFREISQYPSAIGGTLIILFLIGLSIYTVITIPYQEAIRLWRGGPDIWYRNPPNAQPLWVNYFRREKLPETFTIKSDDVKKDIQETQNGKEINIALPFVFSSDSYPQELILYFHSVFSEKQPYASITLMTPDGRELRIADFAVDHTQTYIFSQDTRLTRRLKGITPRQGIFLNPDSDSTKPVKGQYTLNIKVLTFEKEADVNAEFVVYGQVAGWAGTDHQRRDIGIALLWGTPIALSFGLLAALGSTVTTIIIAAIGVWYGGWIDSLIQRVTEVNLVLPFLSILIMVGAFYSRSIWVILGVTILLGIFGGSIITYRSVFLQVKESPYIEAARAYGAPNMRIIMLYLIPRIIPLLIPQLVTLIPTYVFLEASLAVLGLGDPILPTWGKVITDALSNGALFQGQYYWVLEPAFLLMLTGLAFAMLGFVLDRIFNPRLRGM